MTEQWGNSGSKQSYEILTTFIKKFKNSKYLTSTKVAQVAGLRGKLQLDVDFNNIIKFSPNGEEHNGVVLYYRLHKNNNMNKVSLVYARPNRTVNNREIFIQKHPELLVVPIARIIF